MYQLICILQYSITVPKKCEHLLGKKSSATILVKMDFNVRKTAKCVMCKVSDDDQDDPFHGEERAGLLVSGVFDAEGFGSSTHSSEESTNTVPGDSTSSKETKHWRAIISSHSCVVTAPPPLSLTHTHAHNLHSSGCHLDQRTNWVLVLCLPVKLKQAVCLVCMCVCVFGLYVCVCLVCMCVFGSYVCHHLLDSN